MDLFCNQDAKARRGFESLPDLFTFTKKMPRSVAIIPARGGSKGIKNKNLCSVLGKPLLHYCLAAIKKSKLNDFFVSTDCDRIIEYCINNGVKYIRRPQELCQDDSPTVDCITHAIDYLGLKKEDIVLTIQPTSPMISHHDINKALDKLTRHNYVVTATKHHKILWEATGDDLRAFNHDPLNRLRRQDSKAIVSETGSIYGSSVGLIEKNNSILGKNNVGYVEIPKSRSFELDDLQDLFIIESLLWRLKI